ncbi:MAG: acetyltransferase [Clostridia bacterium]|nr:acetyltransferase [Clostridia bacterium]
MNHSIRKCEESDLLTLQDIAYHTYDETFSPLNKAATMAAYLEDAFNLEKLKQELHNQHSMFYFLYRDKVLTGYMKLNDFGAQTDIYDPEALEIERIYLLKEYQGEGLGQVLMDEAIEKARQMDKHYVWLGVWEKNTKGIAFYKKNGFNVFTTHTFIMGDEKQKDFIMRKNLIIP